MIYEIIADRCSECVDHFDEPQCRQVCPVDCIPLAFSESPKQLLQKYKRLKKMLQLQIQKIFDQ